MVGRLAVDGISLVMLNRPFAMTASANTSATRKVPRTILTIHMVIAVDPPTSPLLLWARVRRGKGTVRSPPYYPRGAGVQGGGT
jgi:hypothetical protein